MAMQMVTWSHALVLIAGLGAMVSMAQLCPLGDAFSRQESLQPAVAATMQPAVAATMQPAVAATMQSAVPATMQPTSATKGASRGAAQSPQPAKTYRLMNMKYRVANHATPDAVVCIPKGYDKSQPPKVVIFAHGLKNNLDDVLRIWRVDRYLDESAPNTVLIMPEWAVNPRQWSSKCGPFNQRGFFRKMLAEIMSKTPELRAHKVESLKDISVVTYSGGFRPARVIIEDNGLEHAVSSLVLLDSLYVSDWFDPWLKRNIHKLANGTKRYQNFFFDTATQSTSQHARLRQMFLKAGYSSAIVNCDGHRARQTLQPSQISKSNVLFKHTTLYTRQYSAHMNVVSTYFPRVLSATNVQSDADTLTVAATTSQSAAIEPARDQSVHTRPVVY